MIQLKNLALPVWAESGLADYQSTVDAEPVYARRVARAKKEFRAKNKKDNAIFAAVKEKLTEICAGARRCCYCEDSFADEVEHVYPNDLYPERCFLWKNYLYSCGPCNGPKNNKFAVFADGSGRFRNVTRPRNAPVTPPAAGEAVLLNPREEDPMAFIWLDFLTFYYQPDPILDEESNIYKRAEYTIEVLRLNEREALAKARKSAFRSFRALLKEYIIERSSLTAEDRDERRRNLLEMHHPTVWEEMKRQKDLHHELSALFEQAPETLQWSFSDSYGFGEDPRSPNCLEARAGEKRCREIQGR